MKSKSVLVLVSPASQSRVNGIARFAREHDWTLSLESELSRPPRGWRGDGALVTMTDAPQLVAFARELHDAGIPVVNVSGRCAGKGLPTVCGDDALIGALAAEHFAERRFRHVAWFSSKWGRVQQLRCASFSGAWLARSGASPLRFVWSEHSSRKSNAAWSELSKWLGERIKAAGKPLGVFAYSDYDASRVAGICRERELDVPGEVAILGVDNNPIICQNQVVPISSVNHDLEQIGYAGAELLERLMDGGTTPAAPVLIAPRGITVRRSTDTVAVGDPDLRAAMDFISAHLPETIGAPQVAEGIGLSRLRLDRLFAREIGMSVGREIARQRLVRARLLLGGTDLPLAEVARRAGYCNASYLANVFRRETGLTPGMFRKKATTAG
ncbi:MAG: substrate-binding domain-containing protein [Kiritimatiellae bacterium]|nr:substrate-binding domain-containing protein [Kiritimatiellia bacterium]